MKRNTISALTALTLLAAQPAFAGAGPAVYPSPQDALMAMVDGLNTGEGALLDVFGTDAEDMLSTGNPERDAENRAHILALYNDGYRFLPTDGEVTLLMGADGWPFPIPIAKTEAGWAFDIEAGRDEIYFRRIGLNELEAIEIMRAYVDIQSEFRQTDQDGDGVMEFAGSLISSAQGRDGLYWGDADSPMGSRIALADLDGYSDANGDHEAEPFGGYYYRVLTGQTDAAPGGAMDYMIGGNMVAGHALLAVPSDYGNSGIQTFMVSENGTVLQADLGEDSLEIAEAMRAYDPGPDWTPVE